MNSKEYIVGYYTALNVWHMTEHMPLTLFIATTRRRRGFTYDETVPIRFITLNPRKFFSWTTVEAGSGKFNVSDPEKTIVDSLDLPQYSGGLMEVAAALTHSLNPGKLAEYADRLGNRTVNKRLGYLNQLHDLCYPDEVVEQMKDSLSAGYSWLDPTAPKHVHHLEPAWRLKVNIPPEILRGVTQ